MNNGGNKYDSKKPKMHLLPAESLEAVAEVLNFGAGKYGEFNWMQGISLSRLLSAALRHLFAHLRGETNDPESGLKHLAHAATNVLMAIWMLQKRPDLDDRPFFEPEEHEGFTNAPDCGTIKRTWEDAVVNTCHVDLSNKRSGAV